MGGRWGNRSSGSGTAVQYTEPVGFSSMTDAHFVATFFLQIAVILLVCRLVGWCAQRLGQPQVVGEMVAGFLIGPSLFGRARSGAAGDDLSRRDEATSCSWSASSASCSTCSASASSFASERWAGRPGEPRQSRSPASSCPSRWARCSRPASTRRRRLLQRRRQASSRRCCSSAIAMAITAFPMLARIIYERGIAGTELGTLALAVGLDRRRGGVDRVRGRARQLYRQHDAGGQPPPWAASSTSSSWSPGARSWCGSNAAAEASGSASAVDAGLHARRHSASAPGSRSWSASTRCSAHSSSGPRSRAGRLSHELQRLIEPLTTRAAGAVVLRLLGAEQPDRARQQRLALGGDGGRVPRRLPWQRPGRAGRPRA